MKRLTILVSLLLVVGIAFFLLYKEGTLPVNKNATDSTTFVIRKGDGLSTIANNLSKAGLIRDRIIFYLVVKQLGIDRNIQAGDFRLSPRMDVFEIAKNLTHGTLDVWTTVVEGLRREEIAQIVSQNLGIPEIEFLKYDNEGYLFPDTYLFPKDATAEAIVDLMTANFNRRYTETMRIQARNKKLTDKEVVTIASIVEREAQFPEDKQIVASIFLKRYRNGIPLQSDVTIAYALGYQEDEKTWWKKTLTADDLNLNSPYNTYKTTSLPPTPICNPGLTSINAVLNADENTPYLYFISDSKGHLHFAKTLEEHNQNIKLYMN